MPEFGGPLALAMYRREARARAKGESPRQRLARRKEERRVRRQRVPVGVEAFTRNIRTGRLA